MTHIPGIDRSQVLLLPEAVDDYVGRDGDLSYGRLTRIPETGVFAGWMVIPALVIPGLSRFGIPVSTTFLILTVFDPRGLESMLVKSLLGYAVALVIGYLVYRFAMRAAERHFNRNLESWSSTR